MRASFDVGSADGHIVLTGVTKSFRTGDQTIVAINDVSLTISQGTAIAVTGASGSGKSTLLHLIGGIDRPDVGRICVGNLDVTSLKSRELVRFRRRVGFVFQRFHLMPAMTAYENVLAPLIASGVRRPDTRVKAALDSVGLLDRANALPSQLSGGQQQRVAIARAVVVDPVVILADEPTGSLDSSTAHDVMSLLLGLRDTLNTTLVVVTHDPHVAGYCDTTVALKDGAL